MAFVKDVQKPAVPILINVLDAKKLLLITLMVYALSVPKEV